MADECAYRLMPYGKEKSTERASELKIRGNALYRQKKLEAAQKCYAEVQMGIDHQINDDYNYFDDSSRTLLGVICSPLA